MPVSANLDKPCLHEDFGVAVEVGRLTGNEDSTAPVGYSATIRAWCVQCGENFRWTGVQAGLRPDRPMVSVDETELRAPLRPASADSDFGLGIPGYAITMQGDWMPPSIGRVVHYVSYGTPGGEYKSECRAAVITEVLGDSQESVALCVLSPAGILFDRAVPHAKIVAGERGKGGTWHWPERVD